MQASLYLAPVSSIIQLSRGFEQARQTNITSFLLAPGTMVPSGHFSAPERSEMLPKISTYQTTNTSTSPAMLPKSESLKEFERLK